MRSKVRVQLFPLTRLDGTLAFLCFFLGLLIYIRTLAPGLLSDDSSEYQTQAYTLGMTHPTGYPVYILLAKAFTLLVPVRSIAYRVNLMTAIFAALALALVYLSGRMLAGWRMAALCGVIMLGTGGFYWSQAIIAETYPISAAFIAAEILLLLCWRWRGNWRYLFAAGLLGGLSLGIHATISLMAPAILIFLFLTCRRRQDWLAALAGAALGLAIWLGAFMALDTINSPTSFFSSVARPSLSVWGLTPGQFDSPFERLWFLLSASQFRQLMFSQPQAIQRIAGYYFNNLGWEIVFLLLLGLARLFSRIWREALLVVLVWICQMVFVLNYAIWDVYTFFVPTLVALILVSLAGIGLLLDWTAWLLERLPLRRINSLVMSFVTVLLAVVLLGKPVPQVVRSLQAGYPVILDQLQLNGYPYRPNSPDIPHALASTTLDRLEQNAILLTDWGQLYDLIYVAYVERDQTGRLFFETFPQDGVTELAASMRAYIDANLEKRPIYSSVAGPALMRYYQLVRQDGSPPLYRLKSKP
jgi:hypothetical protein